MAKHTTGATFTDRWSEVDDFIAREYDGEDFDTPSGSHRSVEGPWIPPYAPMSAQRHVAGVMRDASENLDIVI